MTRSILLLVFGALFLLATPLVSADYSTPIRAYEPQSDNDLAEQLTGTYNLTAASSPYWVQDSPVTDGWAYATNYTTDRYFTASGTGIPTGTSATSISAWAYAMPRQNANNLIVSWGDASACEWRGIGKGGNGSMYGIFNTPGCDFYGGPQIPNNTWTHVGMTISTGGTVSLYLNGVNQTSFVRSLNTAANTDPYIGFLSGQADNGWDGYITQVYIYDQTLSANDMSTLYNSGEGCPAPLLDELCTGGNLTTITIYNESTNTQVTTTNGTVQLVGDNYSVEHTIINGSLTITTPVQDNYTITYWIDADVPREHYAPIGFTNTTTLKLYTIDEGISNIYTAVIQDQSLSPLSGVTVSLLRAYILANNTYVYETVEMAKTDTNGRAVFRVRPNIVNYKFLITDGVTTIQTLPSKLTESTNTYIFSSQQNPLTSIALFPSVSRSLTYNNATLTYTLTWADSVGILENTCLQIYEKNTSGTYNSSFACSSSSSGSLIHTVTNTNNTLYEGTATFYTNTQYSTYSEGPLTIDYTSALVIFALNGFIVLLIVVATLGIMALENGSDAMIITSIVSIVGLALVGFVAYRWEAFVGLFIIGGIIIYKSRL